MKKKRKRDGAHNALYALWLCVVLLFLVSRAVNGNLLQNNEIIQQRQQQEESVETKQ